MFLDILKNKRFQYWALNLLHIETLFIVIVLGMIIYFIWFGKIEDIDFEKMRDGMFADIPRSIIKPKPKEKRINKHEERCREIFQDIFGAPFRSVRPDWLKNPVTGKNLELDGFSPDIITPIGRGLAFEYDGAQHARYNKHFHKNGPSEFIYQVKKDSWKDMRCSQEKVLLIRIPDFVAYQDLERYIRQKLRNNRMI